ncbi:MAG: TonB-dependent receptor [Bacteroidia bacterium]|nr:TonB-dependent receptor [Bacteroidia bacterium]
MKAFLMTVLGVLMTLSVVAQSPINVRGTIVDTDGIPIIGANILLQGTTSGAVTDLDGNFTIQAPGNGVLEISYIGYKPQTVSIDNRTNINIVLEEDTELLDEVVVIGYGSVRKNDATGSVTAIKPDNINKGLVTNAQDMMTGKIAGVNVVSGGGTPGGGATIRIRGGASLSASNDPLIVIDGLAMDNDGIKGVANPLSMVNPNDIETFTVLKDASATAIYGSRASNGVIIITTKKGRAGSKPTIQYEGNMSLSNVKKTIDVWSADQFRKYATDLYGGVNDEALSKLGNADTDWQSKIYQVAASTDHNISILGGFKNVPYRASVGYTHQNGILKTSEFNRLTGSFNLNPSLLDDHLKLNLNAKGMYITNRFAETGSVGSAASMDPTQPVFSNEAIYKQTFGGYYQWYTITEKEGVKQNNFNTLATKNPVAMLDLKNETSKAKNFIGSVDIDYRLHFLPQLKAHLSLGIDLSDGKQSLYIDKANADSHPHGRTGWEQIFKTNKSLNYYMQYISDFSNMHNFDIMAGYEWQHFYREGKNDYAGLDGYNPTNRIWKSENYLVSFFGRFNYNLANKYLFTATVRNDGSSRFAKEHRWSLFPSFAFAWKIAEEGFMKDQRLFSDLKLRLGYGITGQQNIMQGDYPYIPVYSENIVGAYYPIGDEYITTYRPDAYNKNLKWEETTTYNAGIDFGFLNNRITGAVDYYKRDTKDLINVIEIPAGTNFKNRVVSNIGSMTNSGVEFSINGDVIRTNDFNWNLGYNATYNQNKITKLTSGERENYVVQTGSISSGTGHNAQAHAVGFPASSFYVYEQVYDNSGKPIEGLFVDRNGDGIINDDDRYFFHNPVADILMGLSSRLSYKKVDLSFTLRASLGNYIYNDVASRSANIGIGGVWSTSGFFSNKPMSALETNFVGLTNSHLSDYYVQDASFLRMDNITIGYNFTHLAPARLTNARLYFTVQNPFVWTKYTGLDPEVWGGIDRDLYPRPMTSIMGLSLTF